MTDWRKRRRTNLFLLALGALSIACLILLGNWQMRRLTWKNALVTAVETRAHGAPETAPTRDRWPTVSAETHAYLRVRATGRFLPNMDISVKAVTDLGPGYWIMSPLQRQNGEIIWINRGFLPPPRRDLKNQAPRPTGKVTIIGLLRLSEPVGTLLQDNDPAQNHWFSRDVDAFSQDKGLAAPAPYFIDAERDASSADGPRGGLTKISFRNNHLQYALTWYAMALGLTAAIGYIIWLARSRRGSDAE
ncbi:SURF1 family protein [Roseibium sp. CAU 1637]|uniref:SURF1-like protein n=1 Tax=Roseibium limicola TaxID=2816037 RepID=A0A939J882_9HYPH|nr:SURF1 family protein [Roseibium limicola]MBO0344078.1 SURF1 family protein [Roseibium limicola]